MRSEGKAGDYTRSVSETVKAAASDEAGASHAAFAPRGDSPALLQALRGGDEAAFVTLVERYHPMLLRLARMYVADAAAAEEVVQETWLGILNGLDRFEARSSLKTWIVQILMNRARSRGSRDGRVVPFSALWDAQREPPEPAVPADRFRPADDPQWPGHWKAAPPSWGDDPEQRLLGREMQDHIRGAIDSLAPSQREVIVLRDVQGWSADDVCNALNITETNQRVLLHRARSRVRRALEPYLAR